MNDWTVEYDSDERAWYLYTWLVRDWASKPKITLLRATTFESAITESRLLLNLSILDIPSKKTLDN
jgi:hypothetical protein